MILSLFSVFPSLYYVFLFSIFPFFRLSFLLFFLSFIISFFFSSFSTSFLYSFLPSFHLSFILFVHSSLTYSSRLYFAFLFSVIVPLFNISFFYPFSFFLSLSLSTNPQDFMWVRHIRESLIHYCHVATFFINHSVFLPLKSHSTNN